jgi:acyl-ACP thioesterase
VTAPFSELVEPRPGGRVFERSLRPGLADSAPDGRVRLDAFARWLQDVAYADVADAGLAERSHWVVRRTRLRVARFPRFGESLTLRTFCSGLGRMWAERRTSIARPGSGIADLEAVALWIHLDPASGRPAPLVEDAVDLFRGSAGDRRVRARLRHAGPDGVARTRSWAFRATDLDLAGHVNNAAYWQPLEEDLLEGPPVAGIDAEMEFRVPSQPGDKLVLGRADHLWIADPDSGEVHASLAFRIVSGDGSGGP